MKKATLVLAVLGALYLSFDFYVNAGYYGCKLNQNGFHGSAIKVWQLGKFVGGYESIYRLGIAYWAGKGVEENYNKAFNLLKQVKYLDPKTVKFYKYVLADIYI
jgi:TPR repeat protein